MKMDTPPRGLAVQRYAESTSRHRWRRGSGPCRIGILLGSARPAALAVCSACSDVLLPLVVRLAVVLELPNGAAHSFSPIARSAHATSFGLTDTGAFKAHAIGRLPPRPEALHRIGDAASLHVHVDGLFGDIANLALSSNLRPVRGVTRLIAIGSGTARCFRTIRTHSAAHSRAQ